MEMIQKRKTRVQIAIIQDERVLLLHHVMPRHKKAFWGFPGGGVEENETPEQAAIREAKEETCLDIRLEDFRLESLPGNSEFYEKSITFIGYPMAGEAKLGHDPEEGMLDIVKLTDIKWHPLWDEQGMDGVRKEEFVQIRKFLKEKNEK